MRFSARLLAGPAVLLVVAASTLVVGCSDDDDATPAATSAPAATATPSGPTAVNIANFSYTPATLSARPGQQLTLAVTNSDTAPHTFTIDNVVDSGRLAGSEKKDVSFTPAGAGTLTYYCAIHGRDRMSGTLNVSAGASSQPGDGGAGTTSSPTSSSPY